MGERVKNPEIETTDWDWPIYPKGLYDMLVRIKNEYPDCQKLYVTENGMGYKDEFINGKIEDIPRIDYIKKHLAAINQAITAGVNVKGYFVWSLMDVLSSVQLPCKVLLQYLLLPVHILLHGLDYVHLLR